VDRQKVDVELGKAAHSRLYRGTNIEQLHIKENTLAMLVLQLVREGEPAAGQHAKADLIEGHGAAKFIGQLHPRNDIGHIKGNNQAVIGSGHGLSFRDLSVV
jgi:hypothetical protein